MDSETRDNRATDPEHRHPGAPVSESATLTSILTAVGAAIVTLIGAVLGGLAGMRYHRKVDRVGLGR